MAGVRQTIRLAKKYYFKNS